MIYDIESSFPKIIFMNNISYDIILKIIAELNKITSFNGLVVTVCHAKLYKDSCQVFTEFMKNMKKELYISYISEDINTDSDLLFKFANGILVRTKDHEELLKSKGYKTYLIDEDTDINEYIEKMNLDSVIEIEAEDILRVKK